LGNCPFAENVVAKSNAVVSKIAKGLARHQGVNGSGRVTHDIKGLGLHNRLLGKCSQQPRPLPVARVHGPVGHSPPAVGHLDLGMRDRFGRWLYHETR
jgi:hypothetical protein